MPTFTPAEMFSEFPSLFPTPLVSALPEAQAFTIDLVTVNPAPHRGPGSKEMAQLTITWHYTPTAFTVGQQSLIDFRLTNDTDVVDSSHSCRVNLLTCSTKFDSLSLGSMYYLEAFWDDGTWLGNYSEPVLIGTDTGNAPTFSPDNPRSSSADVPTLPRTPTSILPTNDTSTHSETPTIVGTHSDIPTIIGGAVSGIVALVIILVCSTVIFQRRRRKIPPEQTIISPYPTRGMISKVLGHRKRQRSDEDPRTHTESGANHAPGPSDIEDFNEYRESEPVQQRTRRVRCHDDSGWRPLPPLSEASDSSVLDIPPHYDAAT
ncbi:hypothetical protein VNI00_015135 [Paramarasmius palmivorus]|uniref:Uncharacterized protein n=1 Tax=Paramarasmius palmivorus TaxID=297713 RepID=A0AAW0BNB2_9AGAR